MHSDLRICLKFVSSFLLERNLQTGTKTYKIESLVVLQSNGLTRVQTMNSTFGKQEQNDLITQDYGAPFVKKMI